MENDLIDLIVEQLQNDDTLKVRILYELKKTKKHGKERLFLIYTENNEIKFTKTVTGHGKSVDSRSLVENLRRNLKPPDYIIAEFHTHPHFLKAKRMKQLKHLSNLEIINIIKNSFKDRPITVSGPSLGDLLSVITYKYNGIMSITIIGSDAEFSRIELWKIKYDIDKEIYDKAMEIYRNKNKNLEDEDPTDEWIKLFEKIDIFLNDI